MKKQKIIIIYIFLILIIMLLIIPKKAKTKEVEIEEINVEQKEEIKQKELAEIKGEVTNPGVYEINENDRIINLIEKAGGLKDTANTNLINLSKKIKDEMVVIIYSNEEIENHKTSDSKYEQITINCTCPDTINEGCIENILEEDNSETKDLESDLININEATTEELQTLPSIGEAKAKSIIEYREKNKFEEIEDIKNVSGIGEALFEKIKDYITV